MPKDIIQSADNFLQIIKTGFPRKVHKLLEFGYRFEIEELFKDAKRLFGLEYIHFKKEHSFKTALWFFILGFWLQQYLEEKITQAKTVIKKCKNSFNQSLTHYWLEQIKFALQSPVLARIFIRDD